LLGFSVVAKAGVLDKSSSSDEAWRIVIDVELIKLEDPLSPPLDTLGSLLLLSKLVSIINEEAIPLNEKKLSRRRKEAQFIRNVDGFLVQMIGFILHAIFCLSPGLKQIMGLAIQYQHYTPDLSLLSRFESSKAMTL
jgi:hypothetical protein